MKEDWEARKSLNDLWNTLARLEKKLVENNVITDEERIEIDIGHKPKLEGRVES